MQRYSRDRDRDDEGGRSERAHARNEDRYAQGSRDVRGEFGSRRESDDDRSSQYESAAYRSSPGSNRWRESGGDRERFEQSYGRGGQQSDYYSGGSLFGGQSRDDDYRESRSDWNEQGGRWQQGASQSAADQRRRDYPPDGDTEYGMYGPRYAGSGSGQSNYGSGGYWGSQRPRGYGPQFGGYGEERGDDRWNRQGYGQSEWQQEYERSQHQMDADYRQWRAEQIRKLDNDYRQYREERYRKFADEFGLWRKNRESGQSSTSTSGMGQSGSGQSAMSQSGMGQPGSGQYGPGQSSMSSGIGNPGSSSGPPSSGATASSQESGSQDAKKNR